MKVAEGETMPELSRFYGLVVKMLYMDDGQHHKPFGGIVPLS